MRSHPRENRARILFRLSVITRRPTSVSPSIGPLLETIGNGGKGIAWNTQSEMDLPRKLNYTKAEGLAKGQLKLETAIDAAEMISPARKPTVRWR
ncbi:hypothetical protein MJ563_16715 [Klebsiella pneumoniae]|nr:hypothetical protein MJ563_16715 [Klebsiella pneumoniae]